MPKSEALTVEAYLAELPQERRDVVSAVRELILQNLPAGYQEAMNWGMISYEAPLELYPETFNGQPLSYIGLAAQKRHYALYLMSVYQNPDLESWLENAFRQAGKKLDMGKACLRFRSLAELPLEAIGAVVSRMTPEELIARYEASRSRRGERESHRST